MVGVRAQPRGRRSMWLIGACLLGINACSGAREPTPSVTEPVDETTATVVASTGDTTAVRQIVVSVPSVPRIVLPDVSVLSETGDLVSDRLGDLIGPASGVDLVAADCSEESGDLIYQGSADSDVFDVEGDGSGEYYEENSLGVVSLTVAGDGSGEFYDSARGGVISIKVGANGSGEYYNEQPGGLVTVNVGPDGTGEYYDDRNDVLLTIAVLGDGVGQYYHEVDEGLLTIDVQADGSAEYYRTSPTDGLVTLETKNTGWWRLTKTTSSSLVELTVEADRSGTYHQSGLQSAEFAFDSQGRAPGYRIELPEAPTFVVSGTFPPLGRLGSLSPRCATVIRFESELLFDFNSGEVRPDGQEVLAQVVVALNETDRSIEINGHTDSVGSEGFNVELSLRRAEAVETVLRDLGLTVESEINGFGESRPVAPNESDAGVDDPAGRAQNRRVEIVIRD